MMQDYATDFWRGMDDLHGFSFYRNPIQNIESCRAITVVDVYRYLVGHYAKAQTDTLRSLTSPTEAKKYKATHFDYCIFSGLFRKRNEKELIQHSGLLCLDFDHVGNPDRFKERLLKHDYFDTELLFTSPSGDGVKWIIPIDLKGWEHSRYFKAVANCIESTGLPPVDKSGSDVARSCFLPYDPQAYINLNTRNMSKKIFSAQEWENTPSKNMPNTSNIPERHPYTTSKEVQEKVETVIGEIEARNLDIAPTYSDWVNLGFGLDDEYGENGRAYFHRLSKLHPDSDYHIADKQYTKCLNSKGCGITLSTFFYLASKADIALFNHKNTILPNIQNGEKDKWKIDSTDLPVLPESLYSSLPPFIQEVVNSSISVEDREVVLLGAIGCFSACFPNVCGLYDDHIVYPNIFLFLVADAGMGKGALNLCRELIEPINNRLHEESKQLMIDYKSQLVEYQQNKKKSSELIEPVPPPQKTLIIPANSSSSAFIGLLSDNDGIGLLFETGGDTLSQTLKSEHGNYSDVLRKGFHHETISMNRRKDREFVEVPEPRFSVILSGTPRQVQRLIPDEEDGLLSRFIYYFIPFRRGIRNVFATDSISNSKHVAFKKLGERFITMYDQFMQLGIVKIVVPRYHVLLFCAWLTNLNEESCDSIDNGMQGLVRRLGLIAFRIMMIFTVIRAMSESIPTIRSPDGNIVLECTEEDFFSALCICETLLYHSAYIYEKLSSHGSQKPLSVPESGVKARRYGFFNYLPDTFDRATYDRIVEERNENASTASKWIDMFIEDGRLRRTEQGRYMKLQI